MDAPVQRPKSLTEIATERLRNDIVSGRHPFGAQLSDADIAALVTYERNAFGNAKGDLLQPAAVAAARQ